MVQRCYVTKIKCVYWRVMAADLSLSYPVWRIKDRIKENVFCHWFSEVKTLASVYKIGVIPYSYLLILIFHVYFVMNPMSLNSLQKQTEHLDIVFLRKAYFVFTVRRALLIPSWIKQFHILFFYWTFISRTS